MTVSKGAAGKAMVMFISNICRRSTEGGQRKTRSTHTSTSRGLKSEAGSVLIEVTLGLTLVFRATTAVHF